MRVVDDTGRTSFSGTISEVSSLPQLTESSRISICKTWNEGEADWEQKQWNTNKVLAVINSAGYARMRDEEVPNPNPNPNPNLNFRLLWCH